MNESTEEKWADGRRAAGFRNYSITEDRVNVLSTALLNRFDLP